MTKKKKEFDKLFVNCNFIKEGEAKRLLSQEKDFSVRSWEWDVPVDLLRKSSADVNKFQTFIGIGRWKRKDNKGNKFVCIAQRHEIIYLEPEIIKVLYNSLKEVLKDDRT